MKKILILSMFIMFTVCLFSCNKEDKEESYEIQIEKLTQNIQKNPKKLINYIDRARLYNKSKKFDLALKDIDVALNSNIDKNDKINALEQKIVSKIYLKLSKDEIFKYINELFFLDSFNPKVYYLKAIYYSNIEHKNDIAIYLFNNAINLIKKDNELLAKCYFHRGLSYYEYLFNNKNNIFFDKSIQNFSFVINNHFNSSDTIQQCYFYRALANTFNGIMDIEDFNNAIKIGGNNKSLISSCYYFKSLYLFQNKKYNEAKEDINIFHKFLNENNNKLLNEDIFEELYIQSLYILGQIYYFLNDYNNSIQTLTKYIERIKDNKDAIQYYISSLFDRGDSYFNIGDYNLALTDFECLLKLNIDEELKIAITDKIKTIKQKQKEKQVKKIKLEGTKEALVF